MQIARHDFEMNLDFAIIQFESLRKKRYQAVYERLM